MKKHEEILQEFEIALTNKSIYDYNNEDEEAVYTYSDIISALVVALDEVEL